MKISASIYSNKNDSLEQIVKTLDAHYIDYFHVDCNDDPAVFGDIAKIRTLSKTPVDLHIISRTPEKYFDLLRRTPVEFVTFQYEELPGKLDVPADISGRLGLAISSDTEIDVFEPYADRFDFLLVMATTPGKSGGTFNKENFRKIRQFKNRFPGKRVHVDGGVNGEVSFILRNMGVYASVSGSYLFNAETIGLALLNLKMIESESHFQVKDFMMSREESPLLPPSKRALADVLQSIEDYRVGFTILTGESGKLEGLISNADVRRGLIKNLGNPSGISVSDMTNRNPVTVNENATVREMLRLIKSKQFPITYLPVINTDNEVTGTVTFLNLIKGEA
ncbi:MAG: CBS domain-containing protein [Bacteroidetes bacterium]|nr:MAG: CBS domain-containing protein [Bacteroidota bacterium]